MLPSFKSLAIFLEVEDLVFIPYCWELSNVSIFFLLSIYPENITQELPRRNLEERSKMIYDLK